MVTFLLCILGIIGYVIIGVIVHIGITKLLVHRGLDNFDVTFISGMTSVFWMIGLPITLSILALCSLISFIYDLIEDITDKVTGN